MSDERNGNRNGGDPRGGGDADEVDLDASPDDATVVITPDEFLVGALERLSRGLRGAADRGDGIRKMVAEAAAEPRLLILLIKEFVEDMREVELLAGGAQRGGIRLEAFLRAKLGLKP